MALRVHHRLLIILCCAWLLLLSQPYSRSTALARSSVLDQDQQQILEHIQSRREEHDAQTEDPRVNTLVHEVWSLLRDAEPAREDVARSTPSGILDTVWYYTKVVFRVLFMNAPTRETYGDGNPVKLKGPLKNAVESLKLGAAANDWDATLLLADMNFYGNFSHPRNFQQAHQWYSHLADHEGNSTAQNMLGLLHATGLGGTELDQSKALLYHTFAAEQDNIRSELSVAYRHFSGIGAPRDCSRAVSYYKKVADKVMEYWLSGPPAGHSLPQNQVKWADLEGGLYGEGASVSSAGAAAQGYRRRQSTANFDNIMEYLATDAGRGDWGAIFTLGQNFYEPPRGFRRSLKGAQRQFMKIARAYWGKDGKVKDDAPKNIDKLAAKSAAYIGRMFLRGEGMTQSYEKALQWLKRGVSNGDAIAQYHLGLMYRDGLGVPKNGHRAAEYLKAAADQGGVNAQAALGVLFLDQGDIETASKYFELAQSGGSLEAFYYMAEMTNQGIGRSRNCHLATVYYKHVAERGEILHSPFLEANNAYEDGDLERAFIASLIAAEHGYESASANVAYLLDERTAILRPGSLGFLPRHLLPAKRSKLLANPKLALAYYTRSGKQSNVDSLLKMGDYYASGTGTNSSKPDLDKASTCYTNAAEGAHSAQALWNLGWMHENGIGPIEQDYHMAKRYYDLALEMNKEAYLPVTLALTKLRLRSWWNGVSGGKINSIHDEEDLGAQRPKTWSEWITKFLDAAEEMDQQELAAMQGEDLDLDAGTYTDAQHGAQDEQFYEGEEWLEIDDGLLESLVIVALAGVLGLLVYARQARQRAAEERRRRDEQGGQAPAPPQPAQGPGQNGGFFPQPGDPDFNQWVVGGVGH